jgi:heat shock protein HslJ
MYIKLDLILILNKEKTMKNKIAIALLLATMLSLVACFNIYTGPTPTTGTTEPGVTPTVTTTATTTVTTTVPTSSPSTTPTLSPTVKPTITPKITLTPTISILPTLLIPLVPFEDKVWVLEQYGTQGSLQSVITGKEPTVKFDSATGKVSGSGGCNGYSGSYTKDKDKITVTGMSSTMMLCMPSTVMQQESEFFSELRNAVSYRVTGGKLEITCTESRLLIFKP